jgi:hypothetical protein
MAFSINLTPHQEEIVDSLREPLCASTKAQVFQRALALAMLYKEALDNGNQLLVADKNGKTIERLRLI